MKKKIILILCATVCAFSMTACANTGTVTDEKNTDTVSETEAIEEENKEEKSEDKVAEDNTDNESDKKDAQEAALEESENTADAEETEAASDEEAGISMAELYDIISENVQLIDPMELTDDFLENYYGIDITSLEDYACYMSETAISAETLFMIKAQSESDAGVIAEIVNFVKEEKAAEMEDYLPEQFEIVDASKVMSDGKYVWLVISENADKINSIIEENIKVK